MSDEQDTLVYKPEITVLLEADEPVLASMCLQALGNQRYDWLDLKLAGQPGKFQVTARFAGIGEPQPGPKATYEGNLVRAKAYCHGFIAGWTSRKH
jgi:hypothetical protein